MEFQQGGVELRSNDGLAQLISSLCEESAHNTVSVFPPCVAQSEPPAPGSLAVPVGSSQKKAQAEGVCKVQRLIRG